MDEKINTRRNFLFKAPFILNALTNVLKFNFEKYPLFFKKIIAFMDTEAKFVRGDMVKAYIEKDEYIIYTNDTYTKTFTIELRQYVESTESLVTYYLVRSVDGSKKMPVYSFKIFKNSSDNGPSGLGYKLDDEELPTSALADGSTELDVQFYQNGMPVQGSKIPTSVEEREWEQYFSFFIEFFTKHRSLLKDAKK